MKSCKSSTLLAGILALSIGTTLARADQPAAPKKIEEPRPMAVAGQVLTEESLQTYLKNLGYRFTEDLACHGHRPGFLDLLRGRPGPHGGEPPDLPEEPWLSLHREDL